MICKVTSFMQDLNSLDIEKLRKWFDEDSKVWIPPMKEIQGGKRILAFFRSMFRKYSHIEWQASEIFNIGERRFFYETISQGTMKENGAYHNYICTIIEFGENGTIKYLSDYFKDTCRFS